MIRNKIIDKKVVEEFPFISDKILSSLLEEIWQQEFIEPNYPRVAQTFKFEIQRIHEEAKLEEAYIKKDNLTKIYN